MSSRWVPILAGGDGTNQSASGEGGFNQTETWPPLEGSERVDDTDEAKVAPERLPALIEVRLELTDMGQIKRLLRVVPIWLPVIQPGVLHRGT